MLSKLELLNFQKHSKLILDFTNGINVIYGATGEGKSCVRRALSWIYFNTPKGEVVRKTGTKQTSAKATFKNGIQVERIKSATVNAYILYINGEVKRFDAIGKDIPEEVQKVLKMTPITVDNDKLILNIADQIALPFLLDKSATFRSKLFNKLTGSDIVDKSLQSLNKDILRVKRESKVEQESIKEKKKQLEELTGETKKIENIYNEVSNIYKGVKDKEERYEKLKEYLKKENNIKKEIKQVNENLKTVKLIDGQIIINLNKNIEKINNYSELLNDLKKNKQELEIINKKLNQLKIPKIDISILKNKTEKLDKLIELENRSFRIIEDRTKILNNILKYKTLIEKGEVNYKEILKKYNKCPFCQGEITEECLRRIKL